MKQINIINIKNKKSEINISLILLITFLIHFIIELLYYFQNKESLSNIISWPETAVIPGIKFSRGLLSNDFYSQSMVNNLYLNTGNFLSILLPRENFNMLIAFSILNKFIKSFTISLSALVVSFSSNLIYRKISNKNYSRNKLNFLSTILILPLSFIFRSQGKFNMFLHGQAIGNWYFPSGIGAYPHGISILFSLLTIAIPVLITCEIIKTKKITNIILNFIIISFYIFSLYIHPVVPLITLFIMIFIRFSLNYGTRFKSYWNRNIIILSLIWIVYAIFLIYKFPEKINNMDFFNIYVVTRHPHHYLPTFYLNLNVYKGLLINFVFINALLFIGSFLGLNYKKAFIYLLSSFLILSLINLSQYFFVEILKDSSLMKLGISRFSQIYNYIYIVIFSTFCISILDIYNFKNIKFQSIIKKLTIKTKRQNFYNFLVLVLFILSIYLSFNFIKSGSNFIKNSPTALLSKKINSLELKNNFEIFFLDNTDSIFTFPREIGNLNVFFDNYFPFSTKKIIPWYERKNIAKKYTNCIDSKNKSCNQIFGYNDLKNNLLFISIENYDKLEKISDIELNENVYQISKIEN